MHAAYGKVGVEVMVLGAGASVKHSHAIAPRGGGERAAGEGGRHGFVEAKVIEDIVPGPEITSFKAR